jgi:ribosome-associated protein
MTDHDNNDEFISKSQVKRDMHALTEMGVQLVDLPDGQLKKLPLDDRLLDAIRECQATPKHGARKRQLKFIGKLLRHADGDAIRDALEALEAPKREAIAEFHAVERWRDRLLNEGDAALAELLADYPDADRQQLRQLVRNARNSKQSEERIKRHSREIFKVLREMIIGH